MPEEIEKNSFEIISQELKERGIVLPLEEEMITKRVIHTSADFDYVHTLTYSKDAVKIAKELIGRGADIVTDTNMALAGITSFIPLDEVAEALARVGKAMSPALRVTARGGCATTPTALAYTQKLNGSNQ